MRRATITARLSFGGSISNTLTGASAGVGGTSLSGRTNSGKLASGSEAQESNRAFDESIDIASGATVDIDLYDFASRDVGAGAGNDKLGLALVMEEIVGIEIRHNGRTTPNGTLTTDNAGSLELQPSSPANALTWFPAQTVANGGALRAGGRFFRYEPDADALEVTDASSHVVRFGANGGDVNFTLTVVGRSVDEESSSTLSSTTSSLSTTTQSTVSSRSGTSQSTLSTTSQSTQSFG